MQKMVQMSQKMYSINKLSQGSSIQVMEKDKEWQDKFNTLKKELEQQLSDLKFSLESAQNDKLVISKNYEGQIKMLSEHLVDLQAENSELKSW